MEVTYAATVLGWPVYQLCWLFLIYGFLGVVIETVFCLVREGVLESRLGLLYVPLRPMYSIGGVACTLLLDRYQHQPIMVFLGGMLICSVVEYTAGSICDKAFGTISWDYRSKPLHLHGKICLEYSCYWGLLVWLTVSVLNPLITRPVTRLESTAGQTLLTALIGLTLASALLTVAAWARTRERLDVHNSQAEGRTVTVAETAARRIIDRLAPDALMINTFPRTRLADELMTLTGHQRSWIRWPRHRPGDDHSTAAPRAHAFKDPGKPVTVSSKLSLLVDHDRQGARPSTRQAVADAPPHHIDQPAGIPRNLATRLPRDQRTARTCHTPIAHRDARHHQGPLT